MARAAGDVIAGKYALKGLLGRGGMGSVWQAKNLTLGTDVAVKLILPSLATTEAGERLFREARAAALLDHPSIVRVFDFGWSELEEPFIVMELLRGITLAQVLAARLRLPADLAVQLLLPVAGALAAAHEGGIVHRDIKPDNVVLVGTPQGTIVPKVVDFGIAKLLHEDHSLTRVGAVLGSPSYMAPEQASGGFGVDERADVWALCVVLYEALAGFRPYEREGRRLLLTSTTEEPTPTSALGAGDEALWQIVRRGLSIAATARWPSMRQLGVALAEWAVAQGIEVDATGSGLEHHWLSRPSLPMTLDLPKAPRPSERTATETTEWVMAPPAPPSRPSRPSKQIEASVEAPRTSSSWRARPLLAVTLAAIVAIALVWSRRASEGSAVEAPASPAGPSALAQPMIAAATSQPVTVTIATSPDPAARVMPATTSTAQPTSATAAPRPTRRP